MPATHLINVDLPAPLSPTSAITSPSRTSKSTSESACTDPKFFETPRSSSAGVCVVAVAVSLTFSCGRGAEAPRPRSFLAVLLVLTDADLGSLQETVREQHLVVPLRDPDRGQEDRGRTADLRGRLHLLALDELDRRL